MSSLLGVFVVRCGAEDLAEDVVAVEWDSGVELIATEGLVVWSWGMACWCPEVAEA